MRRNWLGRCRGGYGTQAVVACDGRGQASELKAAPDLLDAVRASGPPARVVCDRACSSKAWRERIEAAGARACVPANRTHPEVTCDKQAYKRRHQVENVSARMKENRALATRYDKTAASCIGNLYLAAMLDRLADRP